MNFHFQEMYFCQRSCLFLRYKFSPKNLLTLSAMTPKFNTSAKSLSHAANYFATFDSAQKLGKRREISPKLHHNYYYCTQTQPVGDLRENNEKADKNRKLPNFYSAEIADSHALTKRLVQELKESHTERVILVSEEHLVKMQQCLHRLLEKFLLSAQGCHKLMSRFKVQENSCVLQQIVMKPEAFTSRLVRAFLLLP